MKNESIANGAASCSPPMDLEATISAILQEILHVEHVGPDDDFFALGGTSLGVLMIVSQISERLGLQVDISIVSRGATAKHIAAAVSEILPRPANMQEVCNGRTALAC